MTNLKPKSLYIHIPFCEHICDYCDFTKLQYFRNLAILYLPALENEVRKYDIESLDTIYIGGGTPTVLDDDLFEYLLRIASQHSKGVKEFTVECNPESLSDEKLYLMKKYGVNRLSIGVESTNDNILKAINRHHTWADVKKAVINAKEYGFDNINVDLILGLPNVSKELLIKDLQNIVSLNIQHISCYSLTVHDHTVFGIKNVPEPNDDFARELYDEVSNFLSKKGFEHYEVSNWAKEGKESKHNLTYWRDEKYYGVGLGASGYVGKTRYTNTRSITDYNKCKYIFEKETINKEDDEEYYIMLNLRTKYGIDFKNYQKKFNKLFTNKYKDAIEKLVKEKLILQDKEHIWPTYEGMMILDQVIMEFIK